MTKKDTQIYINIEDNGQWLSDHEIENIFEKYATGTNDSIGLWMGLYLCKKIVELHGWNIGAKNSTTLWWACFTIKLS
jgi:K+-sensing histidine kinase KdpD